MPVAEREVAEPGSRGAVGGDLVGGVGGAGEATGDAAMREADPAAIVRRGRRVDQCVWSSASRLRRSGAGSTVAAPRQRSIATGASAITTLSGSPMSRIRVHTLWASAASWLPGRNTHVPSKGASASKVRWIVRSDTSLLSKASPATSTASTALARAASAIRSTPRMRCVLNSTATSAGKLPNPLPICQSAV